MAGYRTCSHYYLDSLECLECLECSEFLECLEDEEPTSGLQRERERFGDSGSATTKVFPFILFMINQAKWYIKQRVKTVTELARLSSENTLPLSPRPTKTGKGIIRMDDT